MGALQKNGRGKEKGKKEGDKKKRWHSKVIRRLWSDCCELRNIEDEDLYWRS
jgi:hypothetical protein